MESKFPMAHHQSRFPLFGGVVFKWKKTQNKPVHPVPMAHHQARFPLFGGVVFKWKKTQNKPVHPILPLKKRPLVGQINKGPLEAVKSPVEKQTQLDRDITALLRRIRTQVEMEETKKQESPSFENQGVQTEPTEEFPALHFFLKPTAKEKCSSVNKIGQQTKNIIKPQPTPLRKSTRLKEKLVQRQNGMKCPNDPAP